MSWLDGYMARLQDSHGTVGMAFMKFKLHCFVINSYYHCDYCYTPSVPCPSVAVTTNIHASSIMKTPELGK